MMLIPHIYLIDNDDDVEDEDVIVIIISNLFFFHHSVILFHHYRKKKMCVFLSDRWSVTVRIEPECFSRAERWKNAWNKKEQTYVYANEWIEKTLEGERART